MAAVKRTEKVSIMYIAAVPSLKGLKMWGVSMAGEGRQRKVVKEMVGDKVQAEEVPFSFPKTKRGGEEVRASALVYLEYLEDHVLHLLDENKLLVESCALEYVKSHLHDNRASRITWDATMPEGEIWVKLGGDKGGSCMKVHAQLCNVSVPNSPKNTSVFTAFEAPDTITNLHIALTRYKEQVIQLQSLMWRRQCIHVHSAHIVACTFLSARRPYVCSLVAIMSSSVACMGYQELRVRI